MTITSKLGRTIIAAVICGATVSLAEAAALTNGPSFHGGMTAPRMPEPHFRAEGPHKKFWEKVDSDCVAVQKPPKHRNAGDGYLGPATTGGHPPHGPKGGYQAPPADGSGKRGSGQIVLECH